MTIVLVHGNPESPAVWDLLVEQFDALGLPEPVRLSPPGFGAPVPDGWGATYIEYRDWLIAELERIEQPVDLVGHDWGAGHVMHAVMARPDLVRTWSADNLGIYDPGYEWHDLAKQWQTPGEGEAAIAGLTQAPREAKVEILTGLGVNPELAERLAEDIDATMGECILGLYRSSAQPALAQLGAGIEVAATRPGLALVPSEDHFVGTGEQHRRSAARAGARVAALEGLGHWWMVDDPKRSAHVLVDFWESV